VVEISSVWIRGVEKVDIFSSTGYLPGAPFADGVLNTELGAGV